MDFATLLRPSPADGQSSVVNPLLANNDLLEGMPPAHIMVCGFDPVHDHGLLCHQKLLNSRFACAFQFCDIQ
jgi:acetyl esterase/lipase